MTLFLLALLPYHDPDGGTLKTEDGSDLVFQIALIGEVEQPCVVAEEDEAGGTGAGLGDVVDLESAALVRGGLDPGCGVLQYVIQHAGGYPHGALLVYEVD